MSDQQQKITVLMPVYNNEKYLRPAIESILNQKFTDFEFLIINDGSTDKSKEIIRSYKDQRIRYEENIENLGIIKTLNKGIDLAKGKYIVRMDGDDISLPERLKIQYDFMEKNPEIGVSGGKVETIGNMTSYSTKPNNNSEEIRANLIFNTPFSHPSVIIRKDVLSSKNLFYDDNFPHAEDYELWTRVSKYSKLGNINKKILKYRMHEESICNTHSEAQRQSAQKIRILLLRDLGIYPSSEDLITHQSLKRPNNIKKELFFNQLEGWLIKLIKANNSKNIYNKIAFENIIKRRWLSVCYNNTEKGVIVFRRYFRSKFSLSPLSKDGLKILKLLIKTIT